jgi:hypothetical protein
LTLFHCCGHANHKTGQFLTDIFPEHLAAPSTQLLNLGIALSIQWQSLGIPQEGMGVNSDNRNTLYQRIFQRSYLLIRHISLSVGFFQYANKYVL